MAEMPVQDRIGAFRELVGKSPRDATLRFGLGNELFRVERYGEAAEELRAAIGVKPDYSAAFRMLGRSLLKLGHVEEARQVFERGAAAASEQGDLQTRKEIESFLKRIS